MDKALETQIANLEKRTGKTMEQLVAVVTRSGLTKHGEARDLLKETLGMGHGDANVVVHVAFQSSPAVQDAAPAGDPADAFYTGPKAALRPIQDALMTAIAGFGDFEIASKKNYVSLRRKYGETESQDRPFTDPIHIDGQVSRGGVQPRQSGVTNVHARYSSQAVASPRANTVSTQACRSYHRISRSHTQTDSES